MSNLKSSFIYLSVWQIYAKHKRTYNLIFTCQQWRKLKFHVKKVKFFPDEIIYQYKYGTVGEDL